MEELFKRVIADEDPGGRVAGLRGLAWGASLFYRAGVHLRDFALHAGLYPTKRLPGVVVSVGNIVLGGTGKTPLVIALARLFRDAGLSPAVLSRGYRGRRRDDEAVVSSEKRLYLGPEEAGDEPVLIAKNAVGVPVIVGRNRWQTGRRAYRRFGSGLFILDDGFQHLRIQRDLNILLLDAARPFGTARLFPRGDLREGVWAVRRADVILLTRFNDAGEGGAETLALLEKLWPEIPVYTSSHAPRYLMEPSAMRSVGLEALSGMRVVAFCGLAAGGSFFKTLRGLGAEVVEEVRFPDHFRYRIPHVVELEERARRLGAHALVTTEKDLVRLPALVGPRLYALTVELDLQPGFEDFVLERVGELVQNTAD